MTQTSNTPDWLETHLQLSTGPQLFANAGISRLRQTVEQSFATRQLSASEVLTLSASDALTLQPGSQEAIVAFAALSANRQLPQLLDSCAEALRPGGRLVLDLRSPAHWQAAFADDMQQWPENAREDQATAFCAPSDLLALASARGLSLVALEPYAGLWDNALLYRALPHRFKWLRLLSWLESDEDLFALALLMEQQVLGRLSPLASGRYLVSLEKRLDPAVNLQWLTRLAALEAVIGSPTLAGIEAQLGLPAEQFVEQCAAHSVSLRTRHVLYLLKRALAAYRPGFEPQAYLDEQTQQQLQRWLAAHAIDQRNMAIVHDWAADQLLRQQVNLAAGLDYQLATSLLREYFKTHSGVSS
ncbi:SAM-dependent methyltransferase [Pseudomonas sp. TE3786]